MCSNFFDSETGQINAMELYEPGGTHPPTVFAPIVYPTYFAVRIQPLVDDDQDNPNSPAYCQYYFTVNPC